MIGTVCALLVVLTVLVHHTSADPKGNTVQQLTPQQFISLTTSLQDRPHLWIIRYYLPWDPSLIDGAAFSALAAQTPSQVARFGEFAMDSTDAFVVADMQRIGEFPTIRAYGRYNKLDFAKGGILRGRANNVPLDYKGGMPNVTELSTWLLKTVPTRHIDASHSRKFVESAVEVSSVGTTTDSVTSHRKAKSILLFVDPSVAAHQLTLAIAFGLGSTYKASVNMMYSFDTALAEHFGVKARPAAVVVRTAMPLAAEQIIGHTSNWQFGNAIEAVIPEATASEGGSVMALLEKRQRQIHYFMSHPIRRLSTVEQFKSHVMGTVNVVTAVFVLRESDTYYDKHMRIAQDIAKMTLENNFKGIKFDIYYVDAEIHKEFAKGINVKEVPTIAFIMQITKEGKKAVRFFSDLSSTKVVVKYMNTVTEPAKDLVEIDESKVKFNPTDSKADFIDFEGWSAKKDAEESKILYTMMQKKVEKPTPTQEKPAAAAEEAGTLDEKPDASPKGGKPAKKLSKKQQAKEDAIKAEMEAKKKAKEERVREKAAKEAEAKKAAEEKRKAKAKDAPKKSKSSDEKPKGKSKDKAKDKAAEKKPKAQRDPKAERARWAEEGKAMADRFLKVEGKKKQKVTLVEAIELPPQQEGEAANVDEPEL